MKNNVSNELSENNAAQFYRVEDAMKILHLSRISIYRRIKDKSLRAVKLGRRVLIPVKAIDELTPKGRTVLSAEEGTV